MRWPVFDDCALELGTWRVSRVRREQEVAVMNTRQDSRWRSSCDGGGGWDFVVFRGRGVWLTMTLKVHRYRA
jgi:hypothetical protein